MTDIDQSLKRLGTDYVDLYQIHRWDDGTPLEETLEALHDVVKAGKARYIGASSMFAWQFAKALHTSKQHGWTRFVSMQNHLNLLYREEEREMLPLCEDEGIAVIPWSAARGRLTRNWDESTERQQSDAVGQRLYDATAESDKAVVDAVAAIAAARNVPRAQVALAWVAQKRGVTAPIVGISKPQQLDDALAALELKLTDDEIATLERPYAARGRRDQLSGGAARPSARGVEHRVGEQAEVNDVQPRMRERGREQPAAPPGEAVADAGHRAEHDPLPAAGGVRGAEQHRADRERGPRPTRTRAARASARPARSRGTALPRRASRSAGCSRATASPTAATWAPSRPDRSRARR